MKFRYDINGLRCAAVLLVLFFHFSIPGFGAGFLGVDVFFVISGYLMTGILYEKFNASGLVNLMGFYVARVRRIVPALFVLILFVLIVGWLILTPSDYGLTAKHAFGATTFLSNVLFNREAGYFDSESHEKIFLHTWSLAVEWQFYVVFPVVILVFFKIFKKENLIFLLAFGALLSFSYMVYLQDRNPTANFYLLTSRAWEMLAGGLAYLFVRRTGRAIGGIGWAAGVLMLVGAVVFIPADSVWPQVLTALPVLGTVFLLASDERYSSFLNARWIQYVGRISYSLYLWHWPIVALLNIYNLQDSFWFIALGLIMSFALAHISYVFIEVPGAKFLSKYSTVSLIAIGCICTAVLLSFAAFVFFGKGLPHRMGASYSGLTSEMKMPFVNTGWCFYSVDSISNLEVGAAGTGCLLGDRSSSTKVLLFGDSFAGHYEPFWDEIGKKWGLSVESVATNWCFPSFTENFIGPRTGRAYAQCIYNRAYAEKNIHSYDFIVLAGSWAKVYDQGYATDVEALVKSLGATSIPVIVMAAPMYFDGNPKKEYERTFVTGDSYNISDFSTEADASAILMHESLAKASEGLSNVQFWDRTYLFGGESKARFFSEYGAPYSLDGSHISIYGAKQVARLFLSRHECRETLSFVNGLNPVRCDSLGGALKK